MGLLIGLLIGTLAGAVTTYVILQAKMRSQAQERSRMQRSLETKEREHELRLRQATEALKRDYKSQLGSPATAPQQNSDTPSMAEAKSATPVVLPTEPIASKKAEIGSPDALVPETAALNLAVPEVSEPQEPALKLGVEADSLEPGSVAEELVAAIAKSKSFSGANSAQRVVSPRQLEAIATIATSGTVSQIPQLIELASVSDSTLRSAVAVVISGMATAHAGQAEVLASIPALEKLSRDPDAAVRKNAIGALSKIPSKEVIPILQRALRDTEPSVVAAASAAIALYKVYPVSKPKPKPANAAPREQDR